MGDLLTQFGAKLLEVVLPTLATAIGGLIVALLSKQLKKVKIELTAEQEERLRQIVEDAVLATEEAARRQATTGQPMTSIEKDRHTAQVVLEKLPEIPPDKLRHAIDAALPAVRKQLAPSAPATFSAGGIERRREQ